MARPHLKIHKGEWLVLSERPSDESFMADIDGAGKSPVAAWLDYSRNFEQIVAESERVVMAEFLRIGKKFLPVILALVAGFLIGRLYGAS